MVLLLDGNYCITIIKLGQVVFLCYIYHMKKPNSQDGNKRALIAHFPFWLKAIFPLLIAAAAIAWCSICSNIDNQQQQQTAKPDTQAKGTYQISPYIAAPIQSPANQQKEKSPTGKNQCVLPCGWINHALGDAVAVFTAILAYLVYLQLLWMTRQERVLQASVDAAKKSADAAQKSAEVSERVMLQAQRAIIAMKGVSAELSYNNVKVMGIYIYVRWTNTGSTPAIHCNAGVTFEISKPEPDTIVFSKNPIQQNDNVTIGPMTGINSANTIWADDLARVWKNEASLFILSRIEYEDVFGVKHHTQVCSKAQFFTDPLAFPVSEHAFKYSWGVWKEHNSSD